MMHGKAARLDSDAVFLYLHRPSIDFYRTGYNLTSLRPIFQTIYEKNHFNADRDLLISTEAVLLQCNSLTLCF